MSVDPYAGFGAAVDFLSGLAYSPGGIYVPPPGSDAPDQMVVGITARARWSR